MLSTPELVLRLALGALFGGIIGYERQVHGRPAGFRTHMLVCIASVLIMEVSEYFHYLAEQDPSYVRIDPGRIASGAITGVGFLGAGVIIKTGVTVHGLTTAACLWMVSAIGLALGTGLYTAATVSFAITLFALLVLRYVERATSKTVFKFLSVSAGGRVSEGRIDETLKRHGATVFNTDYEKDMASGELTLHYTIAISDASSVRQVLEELSSVEEVRQVSLKT
jgi:putative Mg2+ transporter-C (MgtC) family protein